MSSQLVIKEEQTQERVKITLEGEVDIYTCKEMKIKLYDMADKYKGDMFIDCRNLKYIDSTGLGVFVAVLKRVKKYGGRIFLSQLNDNIKKLFLITGLDRLFSLV